MRRVLPFPLLSLALMAMWLLLNRSLSPGHLLLGSLLALVAPLLMIALQLPRARLRRPRAMLKLFGLVLADIIRSNNAVALIILNPLHTRRRSGFVDIPLELRDPYGLALLACIITATPGTLWSQYNPGNGVMKLHVLDLIDEQVWVERIKGRYETLLLEIFE